MLHPTPDRLEAYVDGSLADADRAVLESHIVSCGRCEAEVEEWRALFAALSSLPHVEPTAGFADRVMAGVHVHQPWPARVAALLRRLVPTTTAGWALASAFLALPVLLAGGTTAWLLSRPWLTPQGLWLFARERAVDAVLSLAGRAGVAVLESDAALGVTTWARSLLTEVGARELGAAAALSATLIALSTWILYQNLFRTPTREKSYATYCF